MKDRRYYCVTKGISVTKEKEEENLSNRPMCKDITMNLLFLPVLTSDFHICGEKDINKFKAKNNVVLK